MQSEVVYCLGSKQLLLFYRNLLVQAYTVLFFFTCVNIINYVANSFSL